GWTARADRTAGTGWTAGTGRTAGTGPTGRTADARRLGVGRCRDGGGRGPTARTGRRQSRHGPPCAVGSHCTARGRRAVRTSPPATGTLRLSGGPHSRVVR